MPRPRNPNPGSVTSKVLPVRLTPSEFEGVGELVRRQLAELHTTGAGITPGSFVRGLIRRELLAQKIEAPIAAPAPPAQQTLFAALARVVEAAPLEVKPAELAPVVEAAPLEVKPAELAPVVEAAPLEIEASPVASVPTPAPAKPKAKTAKPPTEKGAKAKGAKAKGAKAAKATSAPSLPKRRAR